MQNDWGIYSVYKAGVAGNEPMVVMVLKIESFLSGGWPGLDLRWWYVIEIDQSEMGDGMRCGLSRLVAQ
jgi:hypothetical protein